MFLSKGCSRRTADISVPLKNSFIHTGHGDIAGSNWGDPSQIDEVYLRNPMDPPDLFEEDKGLANQLRSKIHSSSFQFNYSKLKAEPEQKRPTSDPVRQRAQSQRQPSNTSQKKQQTKRPVAPTVGNESPSAASHVSVEMKQPNKTQEALLIDLATSPKTTSQDTAKEPSNLDIFDSLCISTEQPYGNINLPEPLFSTKEPDPFDVNARFHALPNNGSVNWGRDSMGSSSSFSSTTQDSNNILTREGNQSSTSLQLTSRSSYPQLGKTLSNNYTTGGSPIGPQSKQTVSQYNGQSNFSLMPQTSSGTSDKDSAFTSVGAVGGELLYCEPPCEDPSYTSSTTNRFSSPSVGRPQGGSMKAVGLERNIKLQPAAGLDPTFRQHLQNVVQASVVQMSSNKILPPPQQQSRRQQSDESNNSSQPNNSAQVHGRNPFIQQQSSLSHNVVKPTAKMSQPDPDKIKTEKAFDWLNEALKSNLTIQSKKIMTKDFRLEKETNKTDQQIVTPAKCDPLSQVKGHVATRSLTSGGNRTVKTMSSLSLPLYDDVPVDEGFQSSQYSNMASEQTSYLNKMSGNNNNNVDLMYTADSYADSDSTWEDDFDEEEEDFREEVIKELNSDDVQSNKPPPLPPRTYMRNSRAQTVSEKPYILPLKQDGHQLSHTHYFLIPSINEQDSSYKREKSPPQRTTATVKPFLVNTAFDMSDERSHLRDYQNVSGLVRPDVVHRSLSNMSSSSSKSSAGSSGLGESPPRSHHHYYRSQSSPSKPRPIQARRGVNHGDGDGRLMGSSPQDRIALVQSRVIGVTDDECYTALSTTHWDVESAIKYLKVEQLFRMGVAPRATCHRLLETLNWNLELASSVIIDEVNNMKKGRIESTV